MVTAWLHTQGGDSINTLLQRLARQCHLEPLLAVILWGGVYPGAKLGLRAIPVLSFTAGRLLVATIMLCLVSPRLKAWRLPRALWPALLQAGLAQTALQVLLIAGLHRTSASHSAILLATAPLLTAIWLAVTRQTTLGKRQWSGLLLGVIGVGLVVQGGDLGITGARLDGDILALAAAAAWVWYGLAIAPLVSTLGAVRATGWSMALAACGFTPLALREIQAYAWQSVSWVAWAGLLYGATLGMVLAMSLWAQAIHRFGTQQTMLYVYLEPVSAVLIAAMVLGETLRPLQALGALLTLLSVALASTR